MHACSVGTGFISNLLVASLAGGLVYKASADILGRSYDCRLKAGIFTTGKVSGKCPFGLTSSGTNTKNALCNDPNARDSDCSLRDTTTGITCFGPPPAGRAVLGGSQQGVRLCKTLGM